MRVIPLGGERALGEGLGEGRFVSGRCVIGEEQVAADERDGQ